ncbi:hypothetical protein YDYSG_56000 [Paenibacillus tyrfis]|uniref:hypothetical protein n=1 Tax=Paenibacillus tyrfis TaxID=1501230 RepID=UPI002490D1A0|nr:hypothetical protein [Paenibacillus tyrfis]GLI09568.1 hypothetical protein YDYSG_56000 [Paenibacillus tyrfis]
MKNYAGDAKVSEMANFELNNDPKKLQTFIDSGDINETYMEQLAIATNYNLLVGRENYTIAPNDMTTREEAVTLAMRYGNFVYALKYNAMK